MIANNKAATYLVAAACPACQPNSSAPKWITLEFETKEYALEYLRAYPERFDGLIVMSPFGLDSEFRPSCGHQVE